MYSLSEIASILGRDRVTMLGLQKRFDLPSIKGAGYPECVMSFLRDVVFLKLAQVPDAQVLELWSLECKLMALLNADGLGSVTWMVDGRAQQGNDDRRLFLSGFDVGAELKTSAVQPGLDFSPSEAELFGGSEMGEDVLRLLESYLELLTPIRTMLSEQSAILIAAGQWAKGKGEEASE